MAQDWPPARPVVPPFPQELELTPKEVLVLLVELNGRYAGRFQRAIDALHLDIDQFRFE